MVDETTELVGVETPEGKGLTGESTYGLSLQKAYKDGLLSL